MVAETVEVSNEAACSALLALLSEYSSSLSLSSASVYALEAGGHALGKLVVPVWWCTIWSRGVREHALPSLLDRAMASVCIAQAWLRLYSTAQLLCVPQNKPRYARTARGGSAGLPDFGGCLRPNTEKR